MDPSFKVYAPWRDPVLLEEFPGRSQMLSFLQKHLGWRCQRIPRILKKTAPANVYINTHTPYKIRDLLRPY